MAGRTAAGHLETVLLVSHDRWLLARTADRVITVEARTVWVHGGGFAAYTDARRDRAARLDERRRRWDEEHSRLRGLVHTLRQRSAKQRRDGLRVPGGTDPAGPVRERRPAGPRPFETLSGGQQAWLQILLLELSGCTLLLLDEPTDDLDLAGAQALRDALEDYAGTVLTVAHDRWFAADADRYLIFRADGHVEESPVPVWHEGRVSRDRSSRDAG